MATVAVMIELFDDSDRPGVVPWRGPVIDKLFAPSELTLHRPHDRTPPADVWAQLVGSGLW